jgi:hypothetical protein
MTEESLTNLIENNCQNENINLIEKKQVAIDTINTLYEKYADDPYMSEKTHNYICNQLPNILENIKRVHLERVTRMEELSIEQDAFIHSFLNYNQYFYISSTEKFFYYDGIHYHLYNEDDILYHVLSSISRDRQLMSWKQRTRIHIMKRIRENSLLKTIPESETIQSVIDSLCPALFATRPEVKYFLTILGDNILRKNTNQIHFFNSKAKHFIRELNNISQLLIGVGLSQSIKHKYYDHSYQDCRLIKINECVKNESAWVPILKQQALDIICVACHYSSRYESSDNYVLNSSNDSALISSAFFMKSILPGDLVASFMSEYLNIDENKVKPSVINQFDNIRTPQITWKNMQYLWKHFLDSKNLPSIIFMQTLKTLLVEKLTDYYSESNDSFLGICSKYLPAIQKFLQFWNDTILIDETETDLEIEEVIILFRKWCETNNEMVSNLSDKQILDLIAYFFPNVEIDRDKYLSKVRCTLWDKQLDIQVALDNLKETVRSKYVGFGNHIDNGINENTIIMRTNDTRNMNISIYDAYLFYCKYYSSNIQIVSKSYFEKYIFDNCAEFIIESKFLSSEWLMF